MPIFIGDYLKDTQCLTAEEHGAYFLIMMELWVKGGEIPLRTINRIARIDKAHWDSEVWPILQEFFVVNDGIVSQSRLTSELNKATNNRESAKANGKKGGRPRAPNKPIGEPKNNLGVNPDHNPNPNPEITSSPSPSPSKENNIYTQKFDLFWSVYPSRNGKKLQKGKALEAFKRLPLKDLDRVIENAQNHGVDNNFAKDPKRFLTGDFWKDWDKPQTNGQPQLPPDRKGFRMP